VGLLADCCLEIFVVDVFALRIAGQGRNLGRAYRVEVAMRFRHVFERLDAIVSVDIKEERLQLRDLAVLCDVHLRQPVDRANPLHDGI